MDGTAIKVVEGREGSVLREVRKTGNTATDRGDSRKMSKCQNDGLVLSVSLSVCRSLFHFIISRDDHCFCNTSMS